MVGRIRHWSRQFAEDPDYKLCQMILRFVRPERIPDKMWIRYRFHYVFGYPLDLNHAKTFNEKLNWLKLFDNNPLYTKLVDKFSVKEWVAERIGEQYIIPTLGVYHSFDEISFDLLPERFVLKCTHDSGSTIICHDKHKFDLRYAKELLETALNRNFYFVNRERPYKSVRPRIIVEAYLDGLEDVNDYKYFCFNGKVRAMFVATERQNEKKETRFDFFDENYNHLDLTNGHPNAEVVPEKPTRFDLMKLLAEILSKGIPHVRVDFYEVKGQVYFGEMTFYHWGGFMPFNPKKWDDVFGSWIDLPKVQR